ncbi:HD family phosphohydrolase [Laceyella putida]|uniref:HD family phosphohydrolase n=1 Tax=Laceyella putida TaxID=110101 RepID=A0ABW2RHX3_9BACL
MKEKKEPSSTEALMWFTDRWKTSKRMQLLLYAILGIAFYLLFIKHILPERVQIQVGMVSPETIVSPVTKIDRAATEEAKEQAAEKVDRVYTTDDRVTNQQVDKIDRFFADIRKVLSDGDLSADEKEKQVKLVLNEAISEDFQGPFYHTVAALSPDSLTDIRLKTREIVYDILKKGVRKSELKEKRESVDDKILATMIENSLDSKARIVIREIAKKSIVANEFYDEQQTEQLRDAAREAVQPIPINKGQIIVALGEVVTEDQYRKLEELGLLRKDSNFLPQVGLGLFVITILTALFFYIRRFHPNLYHNNANLLLLFSVLLLTLIGMKFIALGQNLEWNMLGYIAPVGLGTMLITLLLNIELAVVCAMILAVAASMLFNGENHLLFDFRYGLVALISGTAAAFALADVRKRGGILQAGMVAALASVFPIAALHFMLPSEGTWMVLVQSLVFGMLSGLFSAVLTIGFLPYFETAFGILSPMRLIELGNPNHPLLRKLLIETPGTYHHSIIVGNLSEAAAEAIGADGLLARVGAYYHDVGKTKRPQFFIENQLHRLNPHDKISPNLSKTIIISHTRDGVEILKQHKIPKQIQDIAAQHHGTTLIRYFYHKALQQKKDGDQVREEDYRYPGPKAQFKEAAIVGICDCVEAAVRSLARPTPSRIQNMVNKIIRDRLEDGQFNECDLTLKELEMIANSICETLQGIFHSRIEYPEEPAKGVKQG